MAKVAVHGSLSSNALHFGGGGALKVDVGVKRKTPSELRDEQLQRKCVELIDESTAPLLGAMKNTQGVSRGLRKTDPMKNPRYVDTRMDELYQVRKPSSRLRLLSGKENTRENTCVEKAGITKNLSFSSSFASMVQSQYPCTVENSCAPAEIVKDSVDQDSQTIEKCSQNTFRTVAELSLGGEKSFGLENVDMDKALKGLVARENPALSSLPDDSTNRLGDLTSNYTGNFCSEFHLCGGKAPLDFTLKTSMRVVSSSSVNWLHRLMMCGTYDGTIPSASKFGCSSGDQKTGRPLGITSNAKALHSWVYPESSLPPSVISAFSSCAAEGVDTNFLSKRNMAWQDSFRSLYYMIRKDICNIFYVCTSQFVVLFTGGYGKKSSCSAYISRSTRGLRSLLRENDISFSMPLCLSKVEQDTPEDLVELSEIEKSNLGQTRRVGSKSDVDGSPQSLLAFSGNQNVHGLYDFLLNYRSFLPSLTGVDIPVLYSPVPFQNASLSAPEVRCKEVKKADHIGFPIKGSNVEDDDLNQISSDGVCYSIEIKDTYLPPWIICNIYAALGSQGRSFESSLITEPTSIGLNVAIETLDKRSDVQTETCEGIEEGVNCLGISNAVVSCRLRCGLIKGLKYSNDSYTVSLSPI